MKWWDFLRDGIDVSFLVFQLIVHARKWIWTFWASKIENLGSGRIVKRAFCGRRWGFTLVGGMLISIHSQKAVYCLICNAAEEGQASAVMQLTLPLSLVIWRTLFIQLNNIGRRAAGKNVSLMVISKWALDGTDGNCCWRCLDCSKKLTVSVANATWYYKMHMYYRINKTKWDEQVWIYL